jgi:hypothetical protein
MDVPDYALVLGSPARIAGWVCECGHQLDFQDRRATCSDAENNIGGPKEALYVLKMNWRCTRWRAEHNIQRINTVWNPLT